MRRSLKGFGGDAAIIGKVIDVSGHPYTVVGVTRSGFRGLDLVLDPQFWVPLGNIAQLAPMGTPAWRKPATSSASLM